MAATACVGSAIARAADEKSDTGKTIIKYAPVDMTTVSDVLFRLGVLRSDDPAAVEEYIRIHRCGVYEQYSPNDFAWSRIREAQARELDVNIDDLPNGFEIESPIKLAQYDISGAEFTVDPESALDNVATLKVYDAANGSYSPCKETDISGFVPRMHPLSVTAKIDTPVTLKTIPMGKEEADKLIAYMNERDKNAVIQQFEPRLVLLVMKIRVIGLDPLASVVNPMQKQLTAKLDDLRVYEGAERKNLLFRIDFQTRREKGAAQ